MFTGIIEAIGQVRSLERKGADWHLRVSTGKLDMSDVALGDSIAVNGCCLTVVQYDDESFSADVSNETMRCTSLGELRPGARVNLEKALLASGRLGGHMVSGHVDGVGIIESTVQDGDSIVLTITVADEQAKYIAAKGSVCMDGTSLTVNEVKGSAFSVNIIPHTQVETIIGAYEQGQKVNIEVDLVARYLERLISAGSVDLSGLSEGFLRQHGFMDE